VLNCIRVLTRVLPFIFEADHLEDWEEKFFWGTRRKRTRRGQLKQQKQAREGEVLFDESTTQPDIPGSPEEEVSGETFEDVKPLGEELIDTLIDLLFFSDFTLPRVPPGKSKVSYAIWQSGVGCNSSIGSTKELESNRIEVLRLLLTLTSKSLYMSASKYLLYEWTCNLTDLL
jgi:hypothetical protein